MQSPSQRSLGIILAVHYHTPLRGTINLVCHYPQAFYKKPKIIAFFYSRTLLLPTITDIFKGALAPYHTSLLTPLIGLNNIFAAFLRYAQLIIVSSLLYYVLVVNNINESCLARRAYHSSIFQEKLLQDMPRFKQSNRTHGPCFSFYSVTTPIS